MKNASTSLEPLLEFEKKYCCSSKLANSQMMYWYYKILGDNSWKKVIPEIDNWVYHYEQFLNDGGDPYQLKQAGTFLGQYF
ncbi:hypothetical protein [Desulfosporosinus lacus]|uniref:Uncharacterized protein n=1 Tax=Desulfosporosinus lacus DSM 15449 TaxID=1121420 RepID=A0A1M6AQI0_9FIRM|nr:hypothetical protein [Desulfosporosinus lacus]SHI38722.1 hypothetical protein SAMN02746098_04016 [Desulfosporosinus lacus DSM 15449]